jgi:hypothetical protein
MDRYDALFLLGADLALCGAILAAPSQLQGGNNPGFMLLLAGIVVMILSTAFLSSRRQ